MVRVLGRLLKLIVTLILLLFAVQAVIGVLVRVLEAALRGFMALLGAAGGFIAQAMVVLMIACFVTGLVVCGAQLITNRDPRAARERATRDRSVRQRARRPAEGAPPVESHAEVLDDPDPAIGEEERG